MKNKPVTPNTSEEKEKSKEFDNPISILRQRKTELLGSSSNNSNASPVRDFDAVMANEQQTQEEITSDLLSLTRALKEQSASTNAIIRQDMHTLEKSNNLAETNQTNLQLQTQKLQERSGFCKRCWIWLFLLLVCMTFIGVFKFFYIFLNTYLIIIYFFFHFVSHGCVHAPLQKIKKSFLTIRIQVSSKSQRSRDFEECFIFFPTPMYVCKGEKIHKNVVSENISVVRFFFQYHIFSHLINLLFLPFLISVFPL